MNEDKNVSIQITAKKIEIPQDIRDGIKEKLAKLEKFNHKVQSVDAMIRAEERAIECELIVNVEGQGSVVVEVSADTIQAAVDLAVNKTERQLRKGKERASVRRRAAKGEDRDMP